MNEPVVIGQQQLEDYRLSTATYPGSKVGLMALYNNCHVVVSFVTADAFERLLLSS